MSGTGHARNLTNFWVNDKERTASWGGDTRIGQIRLYEHLRRESRTGRHLVLIVIPSAMARATRRPAGRKVSDA
ncbi:hypothetical protein [Streptomyces sp. NBC_01483]|uniref:hypothetical protein n=1 Tax=Streptomyces sp. NBC_01483 TaxID=2903883 RepID=UPI002E354B4C|nr:hypothetical protein [Streptomyces sp. NBC_01483]